MVRSASLAHDAPSPDVEAPSWRRWFARQASLTTPPLLTSRRRRGADGSLGKPRSLGHLRGFGMRMFRLAATAGRHVQLTTVGEQLLPYRDQTLRSEDHQRHQRETEEQVFVFRDRAAVHRDAEEF